MLAELFMRSDPQFAEGKTRLLQKSRHNLQRENGRGVQPKRRALPLGETPGTGEGNHRPLQSS